MKPVTIRLRLAVWYGAVVALVLAVVAAASYSMLSRFAASQTEDGLAETASTVLGALRVVGASLPRDARGEALAGAIDRFRYPDRRILIYDDQAHLIAATRVPPEFRRRAPYEVEPLSPALVGAVRAGRRSTLLQPGASGRAPIRALARPARLGRDRVTVVVLGSTRDEVRLLAAARRGFLILLPLAVLLASLVGYFLARKSLSPVLAMSRRAAEIGATNLHERLPVPSRADELGALAAVLNSLLERLEGAFEQQRRFMADAAHELRTPVAVIRGEAEVALSRPERDEAEYRESLEVVGDEAARLSLIVDDLFTLARTDAGRQPLRVSELYLGDVVAEAARAVSSLAAAKSIEVEAVPDGELPMRGDEPLLRRMVVNLLDNAIKYSPAGGRVTVSAGREDGAYRVAVSDTGPGIPLEAREKVFERFYRVDGARTRTAEPGAPGAGLGLPIARWIAEAHGGRLELGRSGAEGSTFVAWIPTA